LEAGGAIASRGHVMSQGHSSSSLSGAAARAAVASRGGAGEAAQNSGDSELAGVKAGNADYRKNANDRCSLLLSLSGIPSLYT